MVCYAEDNGNRKAGRKFDVDEKNMRRWILIKDALKKVTESAVILRGIKLNIQNWKTIL